MKIPQILKLPLRLLGLGAEPKDSAPLPLSTEVQRTLALITGKNRQLQIPIHVNPAGGIDMFPPFLDSFESGNGSLVGGLPQTFDSPVDYVEVYAMNGVGYLEVVINGISVFPVPTIIFAATDGAGNRVAGSVGFKVAGKITSVTYFASFDDGVNSILFTYYRFNHGRE